MSARPSVLARADDYVLACSLSLVGYSLAAVRVLSRPASRLSSWVDGAVQNVGPRS